MALGGANINWNEGVPSGTSSAGNTDEEFKSVKTSLRNALDSEHNWPSTGGAATGFHRLGSGRAFYGASSQLSSSDTDGRLFVDSTNSRFHHAGSADTRLLGGQYALLATPAFSLFGATNAPSRITQYWTMEASRFTMSNGSTSANLTLQNTYVSAVAFCQGVPSATAPNTTGGIPLPGAVSGNALTIHNTTSGITGGVSASTAYVVHVVVFGIKAL